MPEAVPPPDQSRRSRLLLAVALVYPALVLYGSLFPLTEWRDSGLPALLFLASEFPRYWTAFDLLTNIALYLPLGFLWSLWWIRRGHLASSPWIALAFASAFSLGIEIVQNWLPSRVPSNLDWLCNSAGALLGGLLARRYDRFWSGSLDGVRSRLIADTTGTEPAVALLGLWVLVQLSPEGILFSSGLLGNAAQDWLPAFGSTARMPMEAAAVALHTLLAGLLARQVLAGTTALVLAQTLLGALIVLLAKAAISALGLGFSRAFVWMSTGAAWGLVIGAGLLLLCSVLPARARLAIMASALLIGSAILPMLPASPYLPGMAAELVASPVRNFVGTLDRLASVWPWLVGVYLTWRLLSPPVAPART